MSGETSPGPWELVRANERHGPYITTAFGTTICDFYAMTEPSVFNSWTSKAVSFVDADANAALVVRAVNAHDGLFAALKDTMRMVEAAHRQMGMWGITGRSNPRIIAARAAIAKAEG